MDSLQDIHQYYFSEIPPSGTFSAQGQEITHLTKVMRRAAGDEVYLCDGIGGIYRARIDSAKKDRATFEVLERSQGLLPEIQLTMAVCPTKNVDRFEWFLEKATEMGIGRIIPLACQRSERRRIKLDRCQRILISAMKQSGRSWLPEIEEIQPLPEFLDSLPSPAYIAHCGVGEKAPLQNVLPAEDLPATILIGPEGDFSGEEVAAAIAAGAKSVSLGDSRLRTETAAVVACSLYNYR